MIKNLILVRHGQAGQAVSHDDFERKLTAVGERDARHIGRWLSAKFMNTDLIVSSPARRASATAEILAEEFNQSNIIVYNDELYEASVRTMLQVIREMDPAHEVITIVGHNPTITYVADYLTNAPVEGMTPGSAIILEFKDMGWGEIEQNTGEVKAYQTPEEV